MVNIAHALHVFGHYDRVTTDQRREEILHQVQVRGYAGVTDLAKSLSVDTSTVRRDLTALAKLGLLIRSHGGASRSAGGIDPPYHVKQSQQVTQKRAIGQAAARLIRDGSTVVIDSGSTCLEVARALGAHVGLTVITYDLRVATEIAGFGRFRLIVFGGEAQPNGFTILAPRSAEHLGEYHADVAVLGADGVDSGSVWNVASAVAPFKRAMIDVSDFAILAADSSKVGRSGVVKITDTSNLDALVTDSGLPRVVAQQLPTRIVWAGGEDH